MSRLSAVVLLALLHTACDPWWWTPIEGVPASKGNPMEPMTHLGDDDDERRCDRDSDCRSDEVCIKKTWSAFYGRCVKGARP
jgi:hypothetical protein